MKLYDKDSKLSLAELIGQKEANQLVDAVSTYHGWQVAIQRSGNSFKDNFGIKGAYENLSEDFHENNPGAHLNNIKDLKVRVEACIGQLRDSKYSQNQHCLQAMMALREHLGQRQKQVEAHVEDEQRREKPRKMNVNDSRGFFSHSSETRSVSDVKEYKDNDKDNEDDIFGGPSNH